MVKRKLEVQWRNLQQIKRFINLTRLYITSKKSGDVHLAGPDLTAGWLADKTQAKSENFKSRCRLKYLIFHFV